MDSQPAPLALRAALLSLALALLLACAAGCSKKSPTRECSAKNAARASIEGCAACCKKRGRKFRSWVDPRSAAFVGRARAGRDQLVVCSCGEALADKPR